MADMEILVLGDGAYVHAVLNAVAGISNYGTLGAIGMLIGLVLMGFKGAAAPGGPKLEPSWILISMVMFWAMFIPRVDRVIVTEIMVQPGNVSPRAFVVDNVPLGLAATGYVITNVAAKLTLQYETSFGSATDEARGTTGGLGGNLMMLAQLRTLLANPNFSDPAGGPGQAGYLEKYRENMTSFLVECTIPMVNQGVLSRNAVMNSPGITGAVNDDTANALRAVRWRLTTGSEVLTCKQAKEKLEIDTDVRLVEAFDRATDRSGKGAKAREIQAAFGSWANDNAQAMQTMIATQMLNAVAAEASVRGALSPAEAQSILMVEEASSRRSAQWAGEENLFIRILRPIVGFFEAFFYALAPIMAMLCTMGPFGWSMVGKYLMLPLWVGLWFPMLSITQLYSNIQMKYFFERLGSDGDFTPAQLNQIASQAMDTLGAASALTAATPALAMSLLYGGAVSMSYLAGRLQGSDMIDEGKVSPNASQVAPVAMQSSGVMGSMGSGSQVTGATAPTISAADMKQKSEQLSEQAMTGQAAAFTQQLSQAVKSSSSTGTTASSVVSAGWTNQQSQAFDASVDRAASVGTVTKNEAQALKSMGESIKISASLGLMEFGLGAAEEVGTSSTDEDRRTSSVARDAAAKLNTSQSARNSLTAVAASAVQNAVSSGASTGLSAEDSESLGRSASDTVSAQRSFTSTQAVMSSVGNSESVDYQQMATRFFDKGGTTEQLGEMRSAIYASGMGEQYEHALRENRLSGATTTSEQREVAAIYDTLSRADGTGSQGVELATAHSTLVEAAFNTSTGQGSFNAGQAVSEGRGFARDVDAATAHVGGATSAAHGLSGPGVSAADVRSAAGGQIGGIQGSVDAGASAIPSAPAYGEMEFTEGQTRLAGTAMRDIDHANEAGESAIEARNARNISDVNRVLLGSEVRHTTEGQNLDPVTASQQALHDINATRDEIRNAK